MLDILGSAQSLNGATAEEAMAIVQDQYAASGIPSTLTEEERAALHSDASSAMTLLNSAPPEVDPAAVTTFRPTLRSILLNTSPGPGSP